MGVLGRMAALVAVGAVCITPAAAFAQAAPTPPAGEQPPGAPGAGPLPPVPPAPPDAPPRTDSIPGAGGRDCEHERSPGIGV
jgi:hypothetical protein